MMPFGPPLFLRKRRETGNDNAWTWRQVCAHGILEGHMDCADAVKDVVKCVLAKLHEVCVESRLDDTEYVRNVRAVLEGADVFFKDHADILDDPQAARASLYEFSKASWMKHLEKVRTKETDMKDEAAEHDGYDDYYYDYIYKHGVYPR